MIVSNTCLAGEIYKKYNIQFNHPFIWNFIYLEDYITLINNFQNINLLNITNSGKKIRNIIFRDKNKIQRWCPINCYYLEIDNLISIFFRHYNPETYTLNDVKERYIRRANRINKNDNILFTYNFSTKFQQEYESRSLKRLFELKNSNNILIFDKIYKYYNSNSTTYFDANSAIKDNEKIFKKYLNIY